MKTVIATDAGARPVGPYSPAIRANGLDLIFKRSCPLGATKLAWRDKERMETQ